MVNSVSATFKNVAIPAIGTTAAHIAMRFTISNLTDASGSLVPVGSYKDYKTKLIFNSKTPGHLAFDENENPYSEGDFDVVPSSDYPVGTVFEVTVIVYKQDGELFAFKNVTATYGRAPSSPSIEAIMTSNSAKICLTTPITASAATGYLPLTYFNVSLTDEREGSIQLHKQLLLTGNGPYCLEFFNLVKTDLYDIHAYVTNEVGTSGITEQKDLAVSDGSPPTIGATPYEQIDSNHFRVNLDLENAPTPGDNTYSFKEYQSQMPNGAWTVFTSGTSMTYAQGLSERISKFEILIRSVFSKSGAADVYGGVIGQIIKLHNLDFPIEDSDLVLAQTGPAIVTTIADRSVSEVEAFTAEGVTLVKQYVYKTYGTAAPVNGDFGTTNDKATMAPGTQWSVYSRYVSSGPTYVAKSIVKVKHFRAYDRLAQPSSLIGKFTPGANTHYYVWTNVAGATFKLTRRSLGVTDSVSEYEETILTSETFTNNDKSYTSSIQAVRKVDASFPFEAYTNLSEKTDVTFLASTIPSTDSTDVMTKMDPGAVSTLKFSHPVAAGASAGDWDYELFRLPRVADDVKLALATDYTITPSDAQNIRTIVIDFVANEYQNGFEVHLIKKNGDNFKQTDSKDFSTRSIAPTLQLPVLDAAGNMTLSWNTTNDLISGIQSQDVFDNGHKLTGIITKETGVGAYSIKIPMPNPATVHARNLEVRVNAGFYVSSASTSGYQFVKPTVAPTLTLVEGAAVSNGSRDMKYTIVCDAADIITGVTSNSATQPGSIVANVVTMRISGASTALIDLTVSVKSKFDTAATNPVTTILKNVPVCGVSEKPTVLVVSNTAQDKRLFIDWVAPAAPAGLVLDGYESSIVERAPQPSMVSGVLTTTVDNTVADWTNSTTVTDSNMFSNVLDITKYYKIYIRAKYISSDLLGRVYAIKPSDNLMNISNVADHGDKPQQVVSGITGFAYDASTMKLSWNGNSAFNRSQIYFDGEKTALISTNALEYPVTGASATRKFGIQRWNDATPTVLSDMVELQFYHPEIKSAKLSRASDTSVMVEIESGESNIADKPAGLVVSYVWDLQDTSSASVISRTTFIPTTTFTSLKRLDVYKVNCIMKWTNAASFDLSSVDVDSNDMSTAVAPGDISFTVAPSAGKIIAKVAEQNVAGFTAARVLSYALKTTPDTSLGNISADGAAVNGIITYTQTGLTNMTEYRLKLTITYTNDIDGTYIVVKTAVMDATPFAGLDITAAALDGDRVKVTYKTFSSTEPTLLFMEISNADNLLHTSIATNNISRTATANANEYTVLTSVIPAADKALLTSGSDDILVVMSDSSGSEAYAAAGF